MSNARQTLSGSELVFMPRNLAKPSPALGPYFTGISAWTPSSRRCSRSDTANFTFTNLVERSTTNAPAFTAGEMLRPVGEVNGISAPQSRKVTDPLPRGNADPLDRSLAMGLPPFGQLGPTPHRLQTDTARQRSALPYASAMASTAAGS